MAVAVRRDLIDDAYMELWASVDDGLRVFRHLPAEILVRAPRGLTDGFFLAGVDTSSAAYALCLIDRGFSVLSERYRAASALL